jgi:hypothetical protein
VFMYYSVEHSYTVHNWLKMLKCMIGYCLIVWRLVCKCSHTVVASAHVLFTQRVKMFRYTAGLLVVTCYCTSLEALVLFERSLEMCKSYYEVGRVRIDHTKDDYEIQIFIIQYA